MSNAPASSPRSHSKTRLAVTAAALGVIGCFAAAFTFADTTPTVEPTLAISDEAITG